MRRSKLREVAQQIARQVAEKPYGEWRAQQFPVLYQEMYEGECINVEIDIDSDKEEYVQLRICVDDGGRSAYWPVCEGVVVLREPERGPES